MNRGQQFLTLPFASPFNLHSIAVYVNSTPSGTETILKTKKGCLCHLPYLFFSPGTTDFCRAVCGSDNIHLRKFHCLLLNCVKMKRCHCCHSKREGRYTSISKFLWEGFELSYVPGSQHSVRYRGSSLRTQRYLQMVTT